MEGVGFFSGQKRLTFTSSAVSEKQQVGKHALQLYMLNQHSELLNASSVIDLGNVSSRDIYVNNHREGGGIEKTDMDTGLYVNKGIPFLHLGDRDGSLDFPPSISVCNVTALSFDKEKVVLTSQSMAHIPSSGTKYAYGPWITKCGSTSLIQSLKYATDDASPLNVETTSKEIFDQYQFLSVLRHPMDRALAGFHQVEVF